ncbi:hypothetical protein QF002_007087 [Paraburkholderia youngii]
MFISTQYLSFAFFSGYAGTVEINRRSPSTDCASRSDCSLKADVFTSAVSRCSKNMLIPSPTCAGKRSDRSADWQSARRWALVNCPRHCVVSGMAEKRSRSGNRPAPESGWEPLTRRGSVAASPERNGPYSSLTALGRRTKPNLYGEAHRAGALIDRQLCVLQLTAKNSPNSFQTEGLWFLPHNKQTCRNTPEALPGGRQPESNRPESV